MDACTVTALDEITAFAVANPNCPSQSCRFFQVWLLFGLPRRADHSAYFGLAKVQLSQPFQPSTRVTLNTYFRVVNAAFQCKVWNSRARPPNMQSIELLTLSEQTERIIPTSPQLNPQYAATSKMAATAISNRVSVSSGTGAPLNLSIWRKSRGVS